MEDLISEALNNSGGNDTNFNSTGDIPPDGDSVFIFLAGLSGIIMLIGIPGNLLVIASVIINKELRSAPNFLVLSLSVCDLLFLCISVPVHTYTYFSGHPPAPKACWAIGFITNWLLGSSVMSTGAIAINRYIAIVLKSKYHYISRNGVVIITCFCDFLVPFLILLPTIFDESLGSFGFESQDKNCGWIGNGILKPIVIGITAIFPLVFMTLCYIRIFLHVLASRKRVEAIGDATALGATRRTEARLSLMLAIVYVVYFVTAIPSLLDNTLSQVGVFVAISVHMTCFTVVWMSSAANPVVYGLVNKKYRNAYKGVVTKIHSLTLRRTRTGGVDTSTH
ncbi:melatonin receptor type 1B-A-like [Liolophura sinensis]|uniref:melatonin receptor type 1B-A-like n=1 Tax=Liolophura sinensis TaxID=3198878 RepID=UPI003159595C